MRKVRLSWLIRAEPGNVRAILKSVVLSRSSSYGGSSLFQIEKGILMSAKDGDKSRFRRERKQKLARRKRTQELMKSVSQGKQGGAAPRPVQA